MPLLPPKSDMQCPKSAAVPFQYCAAKSAADQSPGTSVLEHCRNVGRVAEALWQLWPAEIRQLVSAPGLSAALHDVGKVSPGYALKYFTESVVKHHAPELYQHATEAGYCTRHASISAAAIDAWLGTRPGTSPISLAAAAHHGTLDRSYPPDRAGTLGGPSWAAERRKLIQV